MSSGTGSQDPRRTTDGGSRQHAATIEATRHGNTDMTNPELNLPMRLAKKQIRLSSNQGGIVHGGTRRPSNGADGVAQATKNAWQSIELN